MFKSEMFINRELLRCDRFGYIDKDSEPYKDNAILLKIKYGGYVDLDNLKSIIDCWKVDSLFCKDGRYHLTDLMMES